MTDIDILGLQQCLEEGRLADAFADHLGWNRPSGPHKIAIQDKGQLLAEGTTVAELSPFAVVEIQGDEIPEADERKRIHNLVLKQIHEAIVIFSNKDRSQTNWNWMKREGGKSFARNHSYFSGTGTLEFISKLVSMAVDFGELDERGRIPLIEAQAKVKAALDNESVSKKFFEGFKDRRLQFAEAIEGIPNEKDRHWYVSVLVNRLIFIYFLQKRLFLNHGDADYLENKLKAHPGDFYRGFLWKLFFDGFAKSDNPSASVTGKIPYLNGGLFLPHHLEQQYDIQVKDEAFAALFELFGRYNWAFHHEPGSNKETISPAVLGYIFERYINQKEFGAYYTKPQITQYLCQQTIHQLVLDKVKLICAKRFDSVEDLVFRADGELCYKLLNDVLPSIRLIDPACGSGAFLVAAMDTVVKLYEMVAGRAHVLEDVRLQGWIATNLEGHRSRLYEIHKRVITQNIYGVDIMPEACEIARLRLFMALVSSVDSVEKLEPLPNIDFNIMAGNSLIGLLKVDEKEFTQQASLYDKSFPELVREKNALVHRYQTAESRTADPAAIRADIERLEEEARPVLNEILRQRFVEQKVQFEQVRWDEKKKNEGKPQKENVSLEQVEALSPFHWALEFNEVLQAGGFDAIITNPPWDVLQKDDKTFFSQFDNSISKKKMRVEEFKLIRDRLLNDDSIRRSYEEYLSQFPYQASYLKTSPQFPSQRAKGTGTDVNLYKLFTEQCFNLLRPGGLCGIVIPSGIYTDLGAKGLREMLFEKTSISGLVCFENRREIFENVHRSFKFVLLSFRKGGETLSFPAAFMRHDVEDLEQFPAQNSMTIPLELVKRISPDAWSVMEFKTPMDVQIVEKMLKFPKLGDEVEGSWRLKLSQELNMTTDSHLFRTSPGPGRLPLYEGKMIHQFTHTFAEPKYWVDEKEGRAAVLGRTPDIGQKLGYQGYRIAIRAIASSTNERTAICSVLPKQVFCGHSLNVDKSPGYATSTLFTCLTINAFAFDYFLRSTVSANLTQNFLLQVPVLKLDASCADHACLLRIAARLVCTSPEFADLWNELDGEIGLVGRAPRVSWPIKSLHYSQERPKGQNPWREELAATDPEDRAELRAEIDALVAHLYGFTEEEFAYILSGFPIVTDDVKQAALTAFRDLESE